MTGNSQNWTGSENGDFDWENDWELSELAAAEQGWSDSSSATETALLRPRAHGAC